MGRKKRRGKSGMAFVAALGVALASFPAFAGTTLVVGKAVATNPSMMAVNVGDQVGFFKKHGLDLKIVNFGGGARMVQALTAGSIDIGIADGTTMLFVAKGVPMLAVCESTTTLPFSVGVPWDSPLKSLAELKGKKIGVSNPGTLTDWLAQELARKEDWGPDGVTRVFIGSGVSASSAAFRAHQIDAYIGGTTSFLAEEEKQAGRVLAPVSDFVDKMASGTLFASTHLIETDPKALRAFLAAWTDTSRFILTHKDETVRTWIEVSGFPASVMAKEYDLVKGMFNRDCRFDRESLANLRRSFIELKLVDEPPDMAKLYTEAYLPSSSATAK